MLSEHLIIASDLDGTIIDHTPTKTKLAKRYGFSLRPEETTSEIMQGLIPRDIYRKIQEEMYSVETKNSPPVKDAIEAFSFLWQRYGPIYIISRRGRSRDEAKLSAAREWLERYLMPPLAYEHIYFVEEDYQKDEVAKELGVEVYIDDKASALDRLPSVPHRFLLDPYGVYKKNPFVVVRSWPEFLIALSKLA